MKTIFERAVEAHTTHEAREEALYEQKRQNQIKWQTDHLSDHLENMAIVESAHLVPPCTTAYEVEDPERFNVHVVAEIEGHRFKCLREDVKIGLTCPVCGKDMWFRFASLAQLGGLLAKPVPNCYECRHSIEASSRAVQPAPSPAEKLAELILQIAREGHCE